ncbi:WecB/TagA/CpsF family glycosyltransferase [Anthocerotibacter panamensis]|uniref:WecB/TagA/CpsF family glycosyltransferase n=1 Tax=Anthocerotibacter panamensis TaxID=2857077 RepID=UPI001C402E0E|nr:WecB/TagA/CpsF family glycosyltransferase [Anthocerotibacter panamensis]
MSTTRIPQQRTIPTTNVLGVEVSAVSLEFATDEILHWIEEDRQHSGLWSGHCGLTTGHYVAVTGVHGIIESQDDPHFKRILNASGMVVPDGMPLVWLSRLAGHRSVTRVYGPDLTLSLSQALGARQKSAFYYGGVPGVADQLARILETRYPGLKTAGTFSPPFRELTSQEEDGVVALINHSGAHVVWVGLSTPKQERWMARLRHRLKVPVLIGVGAAFDFHTGRVRQAHPWVQRSGFEWLFRLCMEPRRLAKRYLRNNPLFIYLLLCQQLKLRDFRAT